MAQLTDTQSLILSSASTRPGMLALPLPKGLAGAAAKLAVGKMIERGWLEEVEADARRDPLWRETGDGQGTTLIATEPGLAAIGIEPLVAEAVRGARRAMVVGKAEGARPTAEPVAARADVIASVAIRAGTKQAQIIALLQRPEGAAVTEIAAQTGWQAHTIRGAISGALKKKLGLPVTAEKEEGRGTVYRIT